MQVTTIARASNRSAPIVHVYSTMLDLGGVESVLAFHRRWEPACGLATHFRLLFDRKPPPDDPRYRNENFRWWVLLGAMRRRFAAAMAETPGATVVYHQGWWLPFLAPFDQAGRRLLFLHGDHGLYGGFIDANRGLVDGLLCCSPFTQAAMAQRWPEFGSERTICLPVPMEPPAAPVRAGNAGVGRPLVLGYAGRLRQDQKRLDRLPAFLTELRRLGVDFRFEICGEGNYERTLRRSLRDWPEVRFHGLRRGPEYWRTLASWDAAVWFSDWEGGPIGLVEAMAVGTLVFYPQLGETLGDELVPALDSVCHYRAGDAASAARAVAEVFARPGEIIEALRDRARALVAPHTADHYIESCLRFYESVQGRARISPVSPAVPGRWWSDWLPLGLATRLGPRVMHRVGRSGV